CRFVVEPEAFAKADLLDVRLQLPTHHAALLVVGRVVNRALFDGSIRYGMKFQEARCTNFEETAKRILEYVTIRQEELMVERARNATSPRTNGETPAGPTA